MDEQLYNRLMERVKITSSGCWEWQGCTLLPDYPYGVIGIKNKTHLTHRAMWIAINGSIPKGEFICHSCDNPPCINPDHLFMGSPKDNTHDMMEKGRKPSGEAISIATKKSWTPALRKLRGEQTRERMRKQHEELAMKAGVPIDWKFCPSCQTWKDRFYFHKNRARHDGLKPHCKPCSIRLDVERRKV